MAVSREEAAVGFCSAGVLYFYVHDVGCLSACRGFFQEPVFHIYVGCKVLVSLQVQCWPGESKPSS